MANLVSTSSNGFDAVICTGDLGNYVHGKEDVGVTVMQAEADAHMALKTLEEGHELPVYFLPGNHDPGTLMTLGDKPKTKVGNRAINMHGQTGVLLAPGLAMCGLGGSVPGVQGGYIVWEGFPYTEQQNGDHLQRIWTHASTAFDGQFLLLTHCGPFDVGTTVCMKEPNKEPIQSGSTNLRRLLGTNDVQDKVIANLHGHSHDACGMAQVGRIPIINPGALVENRYAILELSRDTQGQWQLDSVQFHRIKQ